MSLSRLASWRKEDCKAGRVFQEKLAVPACHSLLGNSVCPASKAGQGMQQRKGLYLPMAVVQIHQDIQGLKHSTHGVDDD